MLTKRKPVHPGNLFKEEVLIPLGLTVTLAAAVLGVSRKALSEFLNGHSSLSPEISFLVALLYLAFNSLVIACLMPHT